MDEISRLITEVLQGYVGRPNSPETRAEFLAELEVHPEFPDALEQAAKNMMGQHNG